MRSSEPLQPRRRPTSEQVLIAVPDTPGQDLPAWDLSGLFRGLDDPALPAALDAAVDAATAFASRWRGRVDQMDATGLAQACRDAEAFCLPLACAGGYAHLLTGEGHDEAAGLAGAVAACEAEVDRRTDFFDTEWAAVGDVHVERLLADPAIGPYAQHLRRVRHLAAHRLPESAAQAVAALRPAAVDGWLELYDRLRTQARVSLDGRSHALVEATSVLRHPDPARRRAAAEGISRALAPQAETRALVYTSLCAAGGATDAMAGHQGWLDATHAINGTDDAMVAGLVAEVEASVGIVRRLYAAKAAVAGVEGWDDWDRYAPVEASLGLPARPHWSWTEAVGLVLSALDRGHPALGEAARAALDERTLDAVPRHGRRPGASTTPVAPGVGPYTAMSFDGGLGDLALLAHELGHAGHARLAAAQPLFAYAAPTPVAEAAALFAEQLLADELLRRAEGERAQLALLLWRCEASIASVHRQVALHRFEAAVHTACRSQAGARPGADELSSLWLATQERLYGGAVRLSEGYRHWWGQVDQLVHQPGYVHAYALGGLATLAVHAKLAGASADSWVALLAQGGSEPTDALLAGVGCDPRDPETWRRGLRALDGWLDEAESLVARLEPPPPSTAGP